MRAVFAFVLLLAALAVAQANDCIFAKCSVPLESCAKDATCATVLQCGADCKPANVTCVENCAIKAGGNAAFENLASCAAQCIPTAATQVVGLIAESESVSTNAPFGHCSFFKKAACAVGIAGAITACGGPEDLMCIIKILSAAHGCAECFCASHCHGVCKDLHLC